MKQNDQQEKANKRVGLAVSVGIHSVLLLLFFFIIAWRMPDPPLAGIGGAEINLGFVDEGMGDVQTNQEEMTAQTSQEEELVHEDVPEEAIINEKKLVTTEAESPYEVKATEKETPKEKSVPVKEKKEEVDTRNTLPNRPGSESDGDKNVKGDQGRPEGNPDSRNMFPGGKGTGGTGPGPGGNGASMDLPGWDWESKPTKTDPTSENGYVLFEFYVDEDGTIVGIKKIGGANFTPTEDAFYKKDFLENASFRLKDSRTRPAVKTRGVYRFEVRSR